MKLARMLAALSLMLCITAVQATSIPPHIQNELSDAHLSGQGSFRWFGLKIYDAQLWVGDKGYQPEAPTAEKFVLDLKYARELYGERIAQASMEEISQLGIGTPQQQEIWLNKMKALFPDVQEGSHISGVYLPGQGARFYLNGKVLGDIADPEFARAFFAIWLDPRTSAGKLRSQLLAENP
ncbi:MAG: chalcone isomerase family protein [Gallionellaceae bacterium]|jgi:hypothetical protein